MKSQSVKVCKKLNKFMWEFFSIVSEFVKMTHFRTIDCMGKKISLSKVIRIYFEKAPS